MAGFRVWLSALIVIQAAAGAAAQAPLTPVEETSPEAATSEAPQEAPAEPNPDEMADLLNSRQQIQQSFTFTRTIDGEVVETDRKTVTFSRNDPVRPTEAGETPLESLKAAFDREVLTRTEAFEEAKLDFLVADQNRDNMMTADEFALLVGTWRESGTRDADAPPAEDEETARQRQYRAFIEEIDPEGAKQEAMQRARLKFRYMAGAAASLSREDYLREYLLDFDSMDADGDSLLKGEELMMFRAVNRGETLSTQPE